MSDETALSGTIELKLQKQPPNALLNKADEAKSLDLTAGNIKIKPWAIYVVNIHSFVFTLALIWIAYDLNGAKLFHLNILICVLGALIGWLLGTLGSPYNKAESTRFTTLAQLISAFITGFVVSKVDRFIEAVLFPDGNISRDGSWERVGLFVSSLLIMLLIVYINQTYLFIVKTK